MCDGKTWVTAVQLLPDLMPDLVVGDSLSAAERLEPLRSLNKILPLNKLKA